jgi:hypothetical protein
MSLLGTIKENRQPLINLAQLLAWSWSFYAFGFVFRLLGWPASDKQMHTLAIVCVVWSFISLCLAIKQWKVIREFPRERKHHE